MNAPTAVPCIYNGCRNTTTNPDRLCYAHLHLGPTLTPVGQVAYRSNGPLSFPARVSREETEKIPGDSARIPGFPYLRREEVEDYRAYLDGRAPRPSNADLIDRYPVYAPEIRGDEFDGSEIGVFDANGELLTFVPEEPGKNLVLEKFTDERGVTTHLYATSYGHAFAVTSDHPYQVVRVNENAILEA